MLGGEGIEDDTLHEDNLEDASETSPNDGKPKTTTCSICAATEIPDGEPNVIEKCTHKRTVCDLCYARHLREELNEKGNVDNIVCLGADCKCKMDFFTVKKIATKEIFERYDRIMTRRTLEKLPGFVWCGHGCGCGQIHANVDYSRVRCHACKKTTCYKHKRAWHEGRTCDQYDTDAMNSDEVALLQYLEGSGVRCPKCSQGIEKSSGCDHMTCKKQVGG